MIRVICSKETYIYNAYHMTKAFYPSAEVVSQIEEKASNYIAVVFGEESNILVSGREIAESFGKEWKRAAGVSDEKAMKHMIDITLYYLLERKAGRSLAWGILTGVRPTKLAMAKLTEGMCREDFLSWFGREYLVSAKKAELAWEIACREKGILDRLDLKDGYSLYAGIPFCPSVCSYCSFSSGSLAAWSHRVEDYIDALCLELKSVAEKSAGKKLNAVYIGGGTPTTLSAPQLEKLLSCIEKHFSRENLLEYTVEAGRPDSITEEKLKVIRSHGVTRISINPQTMQQKTLDAVGRRHTVDEVKKAFYTARELGFDNINMDLIAGLPGETASDMEDTLRQIEELAPDSMTVHSLAVKRAARMGNKETEEYREVKAERESQKAGRIEEMIRAAGEAARRMELSPYYLYRQKDIAGNFENVGYAKVDKAGIYNILIMEEKQSIIAAGAGASTKILLKEPVCAPGSRKKKMTGIYRQENVKAIDAYIDRVGEMIERKGEWLWR